MALHVLPFEEPDVDQYTNDDQEILSSRVDWIDKLIADWSRGKERKQEKDELDQLDKRRRRFNYSVGIMRYFIEMTAGASPLFSFKWKKHENEERTENTYAALMIERQLHIQTISEDIRKTAKELRSQIIDKRPFYRRLEELSKRLELKKKYEYTRRRDIIVYQMDPFDEEFIAFDADGMKNTNPAPFSIDGKSFTVDCLQPIPRLIIQQYFHKLFKQAAESLNGEIQNQWDTKENKEIRIDKYLFSLTDGEESASVPLWLPLILRLSIYRDTRIDVILNHLNSSSRTLFYLDGIVAKVFMTRDFITVTKGRNVWQLETKYTQLPVFIIFNPDFNEITLINKGRIDKHVVTDYSFFFNLARECHKICFDLFKDMFNTIALSYGIKDEFKLEQNTARNDFKVNGVYWSDIPGDHMTKIGQILTRK